MALRPGCSCGSTFVRFPVSRDPPHQSAVTLPLIQRAEGQETRVAISAPEGIFTYGDLARESAGVATRLLGGRADLDRARVCVLTPPGWDYVRTQWGVWRAGGLAVPLAVSHPPPELAYVLDDAEPEIVVAHPSMMERIRGIAAERGVHLVGSDEIARPVEPARLPDLDAGRPAMMLYTSGTTGRPKGVVITHANIQAQVEALSEAWGWSSDDRILLHLPLHHVHGIVNVLTCALWNGAECEMMERFDPVDVWRRLATSSFTLYMAVPTVYRRLIEAWTAADPTTRNAWSAGARACRLMVSGSAALPVPTLERWREVTGHTLLERYGMTEIGMALSNPLRGQRRPGFVGAPLPGVEVRLVDEDGRPVEDGAPGQIQVRGPTVFPEYWRRSEDTRLAFDPEGWFMTGDQAVVEEGAYRILGRRSVDILKSGGEKISALEIEDVLRSHPGVRDCAVVGVPDPAWGDRVCAAVVAGAQTLTAEELRGFAKERLAPYKVPKDFLLVDDLPRNAMGKVTKPAVTELFAGQ
jgi:malonyl-CoA/methylmalonyl-CoA synthetase